MGTRSRPVELLNLHRSLGGLIDHGVLVRAICEDFGCFAQDVDLVALAARVGRAYCLAGRRCRCRNCQTRWTRFYYLAGVYRPLWEWHDVERWGRIDRPDLPPVPAQASHKI